MISPRLQRIWILNKRLEGAVESLTAGPACQVLLPCTGRASTGDFTPTVRSPAKPRALECSPDQSALEGPTFSAAEPPERTRRR